MCTWKHFVSIFVCLMHNYEMELLRVSPHCPKSNLLFQTLIFLLKGGICICNHTSHDRIQSALPRFFCQRERAPISLKENDESVLLGIHVSKHFLLQTWTKTYCDQNAGQQSLRCSTHIKHQVYSWPSSYILGQMCLMTWKILSVDGDNIFWYADVLKKAQTFKKASIKWYTQSF